VGAATKNVLYERGWWSTGVLGPIGSSMAAARILGLGAEKTHAALGLALVNASGMKACFGSDAKALMAGRASELGVVCAELAAKGASGPERPLDGENGFIDLFNDKVFDDTCLSALGQRWYMADPGVDTKRMPVCLSSHAAVDAVLGLVEERGLSIPGIESIVCDVPPIVRANLKYPEPRTPQEALFSMPFAIAASLRFGTLSLSRLSRETLGDEDLSALMARVSMVSGPVWDDPGMRVSAPEGALVRIEMRDGASFEAFLDKARGSAAYPLSAGQVADKFLACAAPVLGNDRAGALLAGIGQMDGPIPLREIFRRADVSVFT
jgi:2-methylcitrate dehydratase PrpD